MYSLLIVIYVFICFMLTIVILLQSSKGGGLAGAFGGTGGMGAVFGARGAATFLSRVTTILATLFLALSLILSSINRSKETKNLVQEELQKRGATPAAGLPLVPTQGTKQSIPGASQSGQADTSK
ncbi:MAG: preprotein translocase subunit SecG [Calditrichaeota bacterium]|nr:MAG: preprotein translocase subunit SecG [Calditrichota bacterium]